MPLAEDDVLVALNETLRKRGGVAVAVCAENADVLDVLAQAAELVGAMGRPIKVIRKRRSDGVEVIAISYRRLSLWECARIAWGMWRDGVDAAQTEFFDRLEQLAAER